MKPTSSTRLAGLLLLIIAPLVASAGTANRLIVRFDEATDGATRRQPTAAQAALLRRASGIEMQAVANLASGARLLQLPAGLSPRQAETAARAIAGEPGVLYAHPDYRRHPTQAVVIDDPDFDRQWYLQRLSEEPGGIDAESGWDNFTTGARLDRFAPVVAVLDTGIRPHPEFTGRLADDGSGLPGYDFIGADTPRVFATANDGDGRDSDPADPGDWLDAAALAAEPILFPADACEISASSWHGTAVAGIIGAAADASGTVGVHLDPRILPVRVLGRCGGFISDIADAIRWAAGLHVDGVPDNLAPARVINLSFGAEGVCSREEQEAIDAAVAQGALVVAAAGNGSGDAGGSAPGNCRNVLTVAASTRDGGRANYTKYDIAGQVVDISAPGGDNSIAANDIYAPSDTGQTAPAGNGYAFFAGTSFSTPMVSGAAALLVSLNERLSASCVFDDLRASARSFPGSASVRGPACTTAECGAGLLDVNRALQRVDARGPGNCDSTTLRTDSGGTSSSGWALLLLLMGGILTRRLRAAR